MRTNTHDHADDDHRADASARIDLAHCAPFTLGGIVVHPATREIGSGENGCVLEPRVMQVLVALVRAEGAILSRDDLMRCCWDNRIVGEDAINRVMSRLRRVAETYEGAFRVETITKVGYRLIDIATPAPQADVRSTARAARLPLRSALIASVIGLLVALALVGVWWRSHAIAQDEVAAPSAGASVAAETLPDDPQTAALYLKARVDWARRRSDSIDDAIREFGAVIARDPGYAPAYAGLADAYILAREFGTMDDAIALPRAKQAALVALRLDALLPAAERALGFVQYWADRDPRAAGASFRKAVALAPQDAQSHFWYANVLADNGDLTAALREFDKARAIDPESIAIQTDWAWALWSAGDRAQAVAVLTAIEHSGPDFAAAYDSLRTIAIADQDYPRYLQQSTVCARLRNAVDLKRAIAEESVAYRRGGISMLKAAMLRHAAAIGSRPFGDRAWPAFVASSLGDRDALLATLRRADARHDHWGSAGEVAAIARRWHDDPAVMTLLKRRRAATMV